MSDFITVAQCLAPNVMAKTWRKDGGIDGYSRALQFKFKNIPVADIRALDRVLRKLADTPDRCALRGEFLGDDAPGKGQKAGYFSREKINFEPAAHHWIMLDVDKFKCLVADPDEDPEAALREYIFTVLPEEFHGASFSWHLSGSFGHPSTAGVLKAHLWFWLETPYHEEALTAWGRTFQGQVDVSVFRRVQPLYTANPVMADGVVDPVPARSGFAEGVFGDTVPLVIEQKVLARAEVERRASESKGADDHYPDPRLKAGPIGAFCRAFHPILAAAERFLPGAFSLDDGSERRLTWHRGGGSASGAFLAGDDCYIVNTHNTDPHRNRAANAFDLVRVEMFGDLDDDPENWAKDAELPQQKASYKAMMAWAATLPEVRQEMAQTVVTAAGEWADKIRAATDVADLRGVIATGIQEDKRLERIDRDVLLPVMQAKLTELAGVPVSRPAARELVRALPRAREVHSQVAAGAPDWIQDWVFCTNGDIFFNMRSKQKTSTQGFNVLQAARMAPFANEDGKQPPASYMAVNVWHIDTVDQIAYLPQFVTDRVFEFDGVRYANSYMPGGCQEESDTEDGRAAVAYIEAHLARMLPNEREREILLAWIAYCVKEPGKKIRWSPYLCGSPGDGKSFLLDMLRGLLGPANVGVVNGRTLESSFTGWASGRCVNGIEEMKQHGHNRFDSMNNLKTYVSNDFIEVHQKGKDPFWVLNVTNYLLLSNYMDGAPVDDGDRRLFFLRSALGKEEVKALSEAGHYAKLFDLMRAHLGDIRRWLVSRPAHPDFQPDGRAPETAAREQAIELSKSDLEMAVEDILHDGAPGVCRHILSVPHLNAALEAAGVTKLHGRSVASLLSNMGMEAIGFQKWPTGSKKGVRLWANGAAKGFSSNLQKFHGLRHFLDATLTDDLSVKQ